MAVVKKSSDPRTDMDLDADEADDRDEALPAVGWSDRAGGIGARPLDTAQGTALFAQLWQADSHALALTPPELQRLAGFLDYVSVPAGARLIDQDEQGDYLLVVLEGRVAVERVQAGGARTRLAEIRAGDMVGEMSMLDAGSRFSACTTLTPCLLAVLESRRFEALMEAESRLALALLASLARRLSLRLRQVGARLSALLSGG